MLMVSLKLLRRPARPEEAPPSASTGILSAAAARDAAEVRAAAAAGAAADAAAGAAAAAEVRRAVAARLHAHAAVAVARALRERPPAAESASGAAHAAIFDGDAAELDFATTVLGARVLWVRSGGDEGDDECAQALRPP